MEIRTIDSLTPAKWCYPGSKPGGVLKVTIMNAKAIQAKLQFETGYIITISKNVGSMKDYTRFKIRDPFRGHPIKSFTREYQQSVKKLFPAVNKEIGCFTDDWKIDVLSIHLT